jgi:hypothetical protein
MRVDISSEGVLSITAVTEIERYALKQWWLNLDKGNYSSVLRVNYEADKERDNASLSGY